MAATEAGVVVGLHWREPQAPETRALFQVLRFRDGRVVDMQDHRDRRTALRAVGAPSA